MNRRQFFITNRWWGKCIGAALGYLIDGPPGALFGLLIGNFFDRSLSEHYSRPHWQYHTEKRKLIQNTFFKAVFTVMGHIAKADGRITEQHISLAKTLMKDMRLSHQQTQLAQRHFNEGKSPDFDLWQMLSSLREATHSNPELLKLFFDVQFQAVRIAGLTPKKKHLLNSILSYMGFAPLHQQQRFYDDFMTGSTHHEQQYSSSHAPKKTKHNETEHAFAILGIPPTANKQELKRAYRQLMSRNHPDKLIAKGLPEAMIKMANEKTQKIRKAYDHICELKGW